MQWYEEEVKWIERSFKENPPPAGQVAFYGSSSIRLWQTLVDDFRDDGVLNLGFGGATMAACAWFFERIVVPCAPRSIVFYAGDNDLGDGQSPEAVISSFREFIRKLDTYFPSIPFAFLSIKPSPSRWQIVNQILLTNKAVRQELANREGNYFIDVFTPMLGANGLPDTSFFLDDGLHVSPKGYRLWQEVLNKWRDKIF